MTFCIFYLLYNFNNTIHLYFYLPLLLLLFPHLIHYNFYTFICIQNDIINHIYNPNITPYLFSYLPTIITLFLFSFYIIQFNIPIDNASIMKNTENPMYPSQCLAQ